MDFIFRSRMCGMKVFVFCAFTIAILIQADAKALGASTDEADVNDVTKKLADVELKIAGLAKLKYEAEEQMKEEEEFIKKFGVDPESVESMVEDELTKIKESAGAEGLDFDGMKEKLRKQAKKLKEKAKELGFDVDVLKEKFHRLRGRVDAEIEGIKEWAEEQYTKIKNSLVELDGTGTVKGWFQKLEEKIKGLYERMKEKARSFWAKVRSLG